MSAGARVIGHLLRHRIRTALGVVVVGVVAVSGVNLIGGTAQAATPVGAGFTLTPGDLAYILKQVKIAERHSRAYLGTDPQIPANPDPQGDPWYCQALVGTAADQVPDRLTAYGLRTVDGSCNNLTAGRATRGAADQLFPRLATADYAEAGRLFFDPDGPGPLHVGDQTSYAQKGAGNVVADAEPRLISNLIADQTVTNPAAVDAALHPVRSQDPSPSAVPCDTNGQPTGCTPTGETLFIPNITTDVGLSPPYNSLFTFFGQFFDHGLDQTVKGGGTVFVPLAADDPLVVGPDGEAGTADDPQPGDADYVPPSRRFMALTRARNQVGPDGIAGTSDDVTDAANTDSPWVDNSQTYTSHPAHQVFLREYVLGTGADQVAGTADDAPVSTGDLLGGLGAGLTYPGSADGTDGLATWASVKTQARELLGLDLQDHDVTDVPQILVDPYGRFVPGPLRGLPQYVTASGLVEGDRSAPVPVPADVLHFDTPFLTDIAHNADPSKVDTNHDGAPDTWPAEDADTAASADFASQPAGTYDDEMLDAHFVCGDGRCNENIALSSIHQVFHAEHNRLVAQIKDVLVADTSAAGQQALAEWRLPTAENPSGWNGDRLFQAARFVDEMEYQHTVFEEFVRKVQPAVRVFGAYSPDIDPAISAEFAHAVYRFGHSMLAEDVARFTEDAAGNRTDTSLPLLAAFLNPPAYFDDGNGGQYTPQAAAGALIMGSTDQTGNEIDEFVTQVLRNNLVGLPLDLATLNITRARDAGVPRLNPFRRALHAATGDSQLTPYESWADFGLHLKHTSSLVNFVAAYGTHPTVRFKDGGADGDLATTGDNTPATLASRRAAAQAIVDPPVGVVPPTDAADFMHGTGDWADAAGRTTTGLDDVDLWIGGLAEVTNLNGGMLGSTFNYVFQNQMESLQDGDRLYYLARLPGMNLRSQIEANSFGEMVMRTTTGTHTLKADVFSTADCKFELKNLDGTAAAFASQGATVTDDPRSDCDERKLIVRSPDGTLSYKQTNNGVDPAGINGQAVYNGTAGADRVRGGNDNDTVWGDEGDDVVDGQGGDDVVLGGDGDDRITDSDGADVLKGGPGDDYLDAGPGLDILMGGDGSDMLSGGAGDNETFAGPGDDFVLAGQGADVVFGDGGDDWIQGGTGPDLLQGDHGAPFLDDPAEYVPGNEVFVGEGGGNDYDTEGGDDLMSQSSGSVDRNAGAAGFDWAFHQFDTAAADDDLEVNNLVGLPVAAIVNKDRWGETEGLSGGDRDDVLRGARVAPKLVTGAGASGCNVLDPHGVARIAGLDRLVGSFPTDLSTIAGAATGATCRQTGLGGTTPGTGAVWGEGDVLLGGGGSDLLHGRGGDEIIDGDHELRVRISVRSAADHTAQIGWTDLLQNANKLPGGTFGPGTSAGTTLQEALAKGWVKPAQLVVVREIVLPDGSPMGSVPDTATAGDCDAAAPVNCDVAMFDYPAGNYRIDRRPDGAVVVAQLGVPANGNGGGGGGEAGGEPIGDGTDTLWNVEKLRFCTSTDAVTGQCLAWQERPAPEVPQAPSTAPIITAVTAGPGSVTVEYFPTAGAPFVRFEADALAGGQVVGTGIAAGTSATLTIDGLTNGVPVTVVVRAVNVAGASPDSAPSGPVTPMGPPAVPTIGTVTLVGTTTARVTWTQPTDDGGSPLTGYRIEALVGGFFQSSAVVPVGPQGDISGLVPGTTYTFRVRAVNAVDVSPPSAESAAVTLPVPATVPAVPAIGSATAGNASLTARWTAAADGGSPVTSYEVQVRLAGTSTVVGTKTAAAGATSVVVTGLTNGTAYDVRVRAVNAIGAGTWSARSNAVTPATVPGKPGIGTAVAGTSGAPITATAKWTAPTSNGGSAITGYKVIALRMSSTSSSATVLQTITSSLRPASARSYVMTLPRTGTYRFEVVAVNAKGTSARSSRSNAVAGR